MYLAANCEIFKFRRVSGPSLKTKMKKIKKCEVFLDFLKVEKRKLGMKVVKFRFLELKISGKDAANLKLEIPL